MSASPRPLVRPLFSARPVCLGSDR